MSRFKVGDVIERISNEYHGMKPSDKGTIKEIKERGRFTKNTILLLHEYTGGHAIHRVKLVEYCRTPLWRLLND